MKKITCLLLITLIFEPCLFSYAVDDLHDNLMNTVQQVSSPLGKNMLPLRDPFIPQIPVIIPEPPKPIPTVQQHTDPRPIVPPPQPVDIQPLPVTPPRPEKPKLPQMRITGIVWNTKKPQAIINDQVFTVGDKIENFTVQAIGKEGIVLKNGDEEFKVPY